MEAQEQDELQEELAERLARLSEATDVPEGFDSPAEPIDKAQIRFDDGSWQEALRAVYFWLNPVEEVPSPSGSFDRHEEALALLTAIRCPQPGRAILPNEDVVALSSYGLEFLANRTEVAEAFRGDFTDALGAAAGGEVDATEKWLEAWEEHLGDDQVPERIKAETKMVTIGQFVEMASEGELDLAPSYQRADVWETKRSRELIESVLRGIPLPSIILLKVNEDNRYEVIDGKQRLTAILRFIGEHPRASEGVRELQLAVDEQRESGSLSRIAVNLLDGDDCAALFSRRFRDFKRVWKLVRGETLSEAVERRHYFPFMLKESQALGANYLKGLQKKYYDEIKGESVIVGGKSESVKKIFGSQLSVYRISLIEYEGSDPRIVHEVFRLYNKQGVQLNAEEIRNATFHEVELARQLLALARDSRDLDGFAKERGLSTEDLESLDSLMRDLHLGGERYVKTKVLAWLVSVVLQPAGSRGEFSWRSTAKHIDHLLIGLQGTKCSDEVPNKLRTAPGLGALSRQLLVTLKAHADYHWPSRFRRKKKGAAGWDQLQLIGALAGVFLAGCGIDEMDDGLLDLLEANDAGIQSFLDSHPRPSKTQTKVQWTYIATLALGLAETLGTDLDAVDRRLKERFGASGIESLREAKRG